MGPGHARSRTVHVYVTTDLQRAFWSNNRRLSSKAWSMRQGCLDIARQLADRKSLPTNLIYPADPSRPAIMLPEYLTPDIVIKAIESAAGQ